MADAGGGDGGGGKKFLRMKTRTEGRKAGFMRAPFMGDIVSNEIGKL